MNTVHGRIVFMLPQSAQGPQRLHRRRLFKFSGRRSGYFLKRFDKIKIIVES